MNKKTWLLFLALFVLIALLSIFFRSGKKRISWRESYRMESTNPYDTHVIFELLKAYFPGKAFKVLKDSIHGELPEDPPEKSNYVFIGEALHLDSMDINSLMNFVGNGNRAFISSRHIPFDLMFYLYSEECYDLFWEGYAELYDSIARFDFNHPNLREDNTFEYKYISRNKVKLYRWQYIEDFYFCDHEYGLTEVGRMNDSLINFARVKYGVGYFYLHTVPLAFSNIQMLDKQGLNYANKGFSHLIKGPIYWDECSRISEFIARRRNNPGFEDPGRRLSGNSPLQYILGQPPLAWAWYLLIALGLLFLLFRAKRRQRVIPVLEKNTNTSLEFLSTIGRLYFMQNKHKQLALQKMKLFQAYIREHYLIKTRQMDEEFVKKLAFKSEIAEKVIRKILLMHSNIENSSFVSENTLIEFHQLMDKFYQNCK